MTGTDIVGSELRGNAARLNIPAERQRAGALPEGTQLPALLFKLSSSVERQTLRTGPTVRTVDRVSVTVRAGSYQEQLDAVRIIKSILRNRTGAIGGAINVSILLAGTGPDLRGPGNSYEQTVDCKVSYDATT